MIARRRRWLGPVAALALAALLASACGPTSQPTSVAPKPPEAAAPASSGAPAAPAASAAVNAPEQPMELIGKFGLDPARGPWGTVVTATGSALKPNSAYDLKWTSVTGSWKLSPDKSEYKGRAYAPLQTPLKSITTDATGGFRTTFTVPQDFGFQHDVLVTDAGGQVIRNKSGFDVDLEVTINPKSGPPGTPITIEARGIGWRQLQNSWLVSYDNQFTGWISAVTTKGLAKAVIPATGAPGVHVITILHGDFTFPYLNMQQSPEPDRPMFRLPFTVTDGPPVLPAAVEKQGLPVLAAKPLDKGIWTAPASGVVGEQVSLAGKSLAANADLALVWTTMEGNRVATGFAEVTRELGKIRTDQSGSFAWSFAVPNDLGGAHKIVAKQGTTVVGETQFVVQPKAFTLSPSRGPSGTAVDIHLQGVGWTETANIYNLTYDNAYAGYACGFNSGGDVTVKFVMSGAKGWHFIDLYPGIYKGVETRPLNFRVPQLTFAADHPGEDLPAFRFAFYID